METVTWTLLLPGETLPTEGELVLVTVFSGEETVRVSRFLGLRPSPTFPERVPTWEGVEPEELVLGWAHPTGIAPATW